MDMWLEEGNKNKQTFWMRNCLENIYMEERRQEYYFKLDLWGTNCQDTTYAEVAQNNDQWQVKMLFLLQVSSLVIAHPKGVSCTEWFKTLTNVIKYCENAEKHNDTKSHP